MKRIEKMGYRRLYDAINCSIREDEEFAFIFSYGDYSVNVYFGPKPLAGIFTVHDDMEYLIMPRSEQEVQHKIEFEYHLDAQESSYPRNFFTEIICYKEFEVDSSVPTIWDEAKEKLFALAEQESETFQKILDIVVGTIGLKVHPQFVKKLLNEDYCVYRGSWHINGGCSNFWETLFPLDLTEKEGIQNIMRDIVQADENLLKAYSVVLSWLYRGWTERELISKFMAFFTALEVSCKFKVKIPDEYKKKKKAHNKAISELIKEHGDDELLEYFSSLKGNQSLSLFECFEYIAEQANLQGKKTIYRHLKNLIVSEMI